jgi:hypothetical protein
MFNVVKIIFDTGMDQKKITRIWLAVSVGSSDSESDKTPIIVTFLSPVQQYAKISGFSTQKYCT